MPRKPITDSIAGANAAPGGAAAVDRALSLLAAFRTGDTTLALAELATRTQLYKSTVLRLLSSLEHARLVQRLEDGRYALGSEIARLHEVYSASFALDRVVIPVLRDLVAQTGESASYHVRQGSLRLCLYRVDSPHPVRDHIKAGDVLPLDRGTGARVLCAYDSDPYCEPSPSDAHLYASIRERGHYAAVGDRCTGVAGISAPVFHAGGNLAAALTLTMPTHRYDEAFTPAVLTAAKRLSGVV